MSSDCLGGCRGLEVVGVKCSLFNDPEKNLAINSGKLLVRWSNDSNITIDRFDCRGYLQDLKGHDADSIVHGIECQANEDAEVEKLCEYERYLELQTDVHEVSLLQAEEMKHEETSGSLYSAVCFSYDENEMEKLEKVSSLPNIKEGGACLDQFQDSREQDDKPYVCPPDLVLPSDIVLPELERQATIIEKTAAFIARNNAQMEIVLKAKQSKNPLFNFLNYGDKLNPYYKELMGLIKTGRYIPRLRPVFDGSKLPNTIDISPDPDEPYVLKLPKVDISTTAYAALINRFKKNNSNGPPENANVNDKITETYNQNNSCVTHSSCTEGDRMENSAVKPCMSDADYERCYQEYYRYYYSHYYMHLSNGDGGEVVNEAWLVTESARAAATAASAAVNAVKQSQLVPISSSLSPPSDLRGIIDKMAEYVVRNGEEFQEIVKQQKRSDPRFAFLQSGHIHHEYYLAKKKEFSSTAISKNQPTKKSVDVEVNRDDHELANDMIMKQGGMSPTTTCNKSVSFRLTKSASSSRLKGVEESDSFPLKNMEDPDLPVSTSYCALPGMSNYSASESEEEVDEKILRFPFSNIHNEETVGHNYSATPKVHTAESVIKSTGKSLPSIRSTTPYSSNHNSGEKIPTITKVCSPQAVNSSILTSEEIARDIQSMEEQARLQLERRKRAALFAAKLHQSKLRKVDTKRSSCPMSFSTSLPPATRSVPPPPSSVPAAVAHAVVAHLNSQRERIIGTATFDTERIKPNSKSPPTAYARCRRRSSSPSSSESSSLASSGGSNSSRCRRRRSRSLPRGRNREHSRRHRHRRC